MTKKTTKQTNDDGVMYFAKNQQKAFDKGQAKFFEWGINEEDGVIVFCDSNPIPARPGIWEAFKKKVVKSGAAWCGEAEYKDTLACVIRLDGVDADAIEMMYKKCFVKAVMKRSA